MPPTKSKRLAPAPRPKVVYHGDPAAVLERLEEMRRLKLELLTISSKRITERYFDNPVAFVEECIAWPEGQAIRPYQKEILAAIPLQHRVAFRAMHGAGKTTIDALTVLWFAVTRNSAGIDWKCVTTAGAWRQLERYLWPEIRLWARRLRWDVLGIDPWRESEELLTLMLRLEHGEAFAVASSDPALIEGAHASQILYIFDESKSIDEDIFNAAEGAFSTGVAYALASSTPGPPMGTFYRIHHRDPGFEDWWTRHINIHEAMASGAINREWVDQRRKQWGEASALFQNRVLGEFAADDEDGVIPLSWVEAAIQRWYELDKKYPHTSKCGVDVARSGADDTVIAPRYKDETRDVIGTLRYYHGEDTMQTAGRVGGIVQINPKVYATIDTDGLGAGVTDRVREQFGARKADAFHGGNKTDRKDRTGELGFVNKRAAAWWHLRESLDPTYGAILALPPDDRMTAELVTPKWVVKSEGRIQVESKDDVKKRLDGRSTDAADAVVYAVWDDRQRKGVMTYAGPARPASGVVGRAA